MYLVENIERILTTQTSRTILVARSDLAGGLGLFTELLIIVARRRRTHPYILLT